MNVVLLGPPINAASGWGPVGEQGAASGCEAPGRGAPRGGGDYLTPSQGGGDGCFWLLSPPWARFLVT